MNAMVGPVVVALALIGCTTPEFAQIADPTVRVEGYGFSVLPPPGPGWYRRQGLKVDGSDVVAFGKQLEPNTHTLVAMVGLHTNFDPASAGFGEYAAKPEVFAAYVIAATQHMNPPGGRLRTLELTATPDTQLGYCVKLHAKFEGQSSLAPPLLTQEDWEYWCLHPNSSRAIVEIAFSERGVSGGSDPSLTEVREEFFKSLQFRPLN